MQKMSEYEFCKMHVQMVVSSKIPGIFSKAYLLTYAMELSVSGFSATGRSSFNQNILLVMNLRPWNQA